MVYKSLIRSNMEYAAPILIIKDRNIKRLHGFQYNALGITIKSSNREMHEEANIITIEDRLYQSANNYLYQLPYEK
jgi:hypothetical protein